MLYCNGTRWREYGIHLNNYRAPEMYRAITTVGPVAVAWLLILLGRASRTGHATFRSFSGIQLTDAKKIHDTHYENFHLLFKQPLNTLRDLSEHNFVFIVS